MKICHYSTVAHSEALHAYETIFQNNNENKADPLLITERRIIGKNLSKKY